MELGKAYRVLKATGEYLTVGEVYVCTLLTHSSVGLHRANNGGGTYVNRDRIRAGRVVLLPVTP